jgi:hypothetical protein
MHSDWRRPWHNIRYKTMASDLENKQTFFNFLDTLAWIGNIDLLTIF